MAKKRKIVALLATLFVTATMGTVAFTSCQPQNGVDGIDGIDGVDGVDGEDGKSAFEIYCTYHPEYTGTEEEWMNAIATGTLTFEVDVTFDANGGSEVADIKLNYNENLLQALSGYTTTKENYQFLGWTYADGSAIGAEDKVPATGVDVKASFIGDEVVVICYKDGKTGTGERLVLNYGENLIEALNKAKKYPGYKVTWEYFDGEAVGENDTVEKAVSYQYFNAVTEAETYTLTFKDGGVKYDGATISNSKDEDVVWYLNDTAVALGEYTFSGTYGTEVDQIPTPELVNEDNELTSHRYGYTFLGWYLEDGTAWDGKVPAGDTTLYARWAQNGTLVVMYDTDQTTVVKAYVLESLDESFDPLIKEYGVIDYTAPAGQALEGWKFMGRETATADGYEPTDSRIYIEDVFGAYSAGMTYYGYTNVSRVTDSGKQYFSVGNQTTLSQDGNTKTAVYKFYASLWDAKYANIYYKVGTSGVVEATGHYTYGTDKTLQSITATEIVIPAYYQGLPVIVQSGSGSSALNGFDGISTLTKVTIDEKVKEIGSFAFKDCIALEEVVFEGESQLDVIGHQAFMGCTALKNFALPASVTTLGAQVFENAFTTDAELTFDLSNVKIIYGGLFYNANGKSLTVNGLKKIPDATKHATYFYTTAKNYATNVYSVGNNIKTFYATDWANPEASLSTNYSIITGASTATIAGFFGNSKFATITIGEGTEEIGSYAFMGCSATDFAIELPDSVEALGYGICKNSTIVEFDSNAAVIPDQAFYGCTALEGYTGSNYTSIGEEAFSGCTSLTLVRVTAKMETIASSAFAGCNITNVSCSSSNTHYSYDSATKFLISLDTKSIVIHADATATEIVLPEGIESLGGFYTGNERITKVTLPKSLKIVDDDAFDGCTALAEVVFPTYDAGETPTLTKIGESAFYKTALTSVTIPAYVQEIGANAFRYTEDLTEFVLEKDSELTTIPGYMLANSGVQNVYFNGKTEKGASKITLVSTYAFSNAKSIKMIDWGATPATEADGSYTYKMEFQGMIFTNTGLELTLPANLNKIVYNSFNGLTGLSYPEGLQLKELPAGFLGSYSGTTFVLPKSVEIIGYEESVTGIANMTGSSQITSFTAEEGSQLKTLGLYALNKIMKAGTGTVLDLTNCTQLTSVYNNAFYNCKMETLKLPGNITMWGSAALEDPASMTTAAKNSLPFAAAREVKTVEIAAKTISGLGTAEQDWLLSGQTNLTTVVLPEGMTKIGRGAFAGCKKLETINIPSTVTEIGDYAFYCNSTSNANKKLTAITLPAGLEAIGKAAFARVLLTSVEIPAKVETIGDYAFYQNTALTSVALTNDTALTTIGANAFNGCTNTGFTSFTLPATLTRIGEGAFSGCKELTVSVATGFAATDIGTDAFLNVKEVNALEDTDGFVYLGTNVYGYKGTATEITIPEKYTVITKGAFSGNASITKVSFENASITLEDEAFLGCTALATVELPAEATLGTAVFAECSALTSVTIPDNWTEIPTATFAKTGLTSVMFGAASKCETIGEYAFYMASGLTSFMPPKALTTLGGASLVGTGITSINWTKDMIPNLAVIGDGAFAGLALSSVTIESGVTDTALQIGQTSGSDRTSEATMNTNLDNGYKARSTSGKTAGVFMWATLGTVTISAPNATGINSSSGYVFAYAKADATTPFTVTFDVKDENSTFFFTGSKTFYKSAVAEVNFPEKAVLTGKLGSSAFESATALKEIYIPAYLSDFGSLNFKNATALEKVTIGNGVDALNSSTTWASGIFYGCTALKEIVIKQAATDSLVKVSSTVTASSSNCFGGIYGNVTVKVNSALLTAYQAQTNWAKHIAAGLKVEAYTETTA